MRNQRVYLLPEIFVTSRTLMPYMITNKGFPVKSSAFLTEFGVFDFHASVVLWYNATWVIISIHEKRFPLPSHLNLTVFAFYHPRPESLNLFQSTYLDLFFDTPGMFDAIFVKLNT